MKTLESSPKPSIRVSGGTPANLPDYKPMSPDELRKFLFRPPRPTLYQVWVQDKQRGLIPISPKCPVGIADSLAAEIRKQILRGCEKLWSAPEVIPCGVSDRG